MLSKIIAFLGLKGGLVFLGFLMSGASLVATSQDNFCLSCHEMRSYKDELLQSPHAKDADGNPIGCSQCHVSSAGLISMLETKVTLGVTSTWTHFTSEELLLNRSKMRETARKYVADSNCRACHEDLMLNASLDGPVSQKGKAAHEEYLKNNPHPDRGGCSRCHGKPNRFISKNKRSKKKAKVDAKGCVSCHENMAHRSFPVKEETVFDPGA